MSTSKKVVVNVEVIEAFHKILVAYHGYVGIFMGLVVGMPCHDADQKIKDQQLETMNYYQEGAGIAIRTCKMLMSSATEVCKPADPNNN